MSTKVKLFDRVAWSLVVVCVVGWPTSLIWWAKDEPPVVLSLSWAALAYAAFTAIVTVDIKKEQESG